VQQILEALAAPRRREILSLTRSERSAGDIAAHFGDVSRPAISQHLRVLKDAGLLAERREGTRRLYRTQPEALTDVRAFLEQFWDTRLDALRDEAEREENRHA
jgi:DNA-binding transcriptional ArsR family regulator